MFLKSADYAFMLKVLLKAIHWLFPDFAFMWLVEEAKKNMPLELDFLNEGHNAEKVASMLAHFPFLKVNTWKRAPPPPSGNQLLGCFTPTNRWFDGGTVRF